MFAGCFIHAAATASCNAAKLDQVMPVSPVVKLHAEDSKEEIAKAGTQRMIVQMRLL